MVTDNKLIKGGYIPDTKTPDQYVFGVGLVPEVELRPDGQWDEFIPKPESQLVRGIDPYNCTGFNTLSAIETIARVQGIEIDGSDRYLGICAGTVPPGNSPHTVGEAIRKDGLIPDVTLPFNDEVTSWKEYYSFKGGDEDECRKEAQQFLKDYFFMHEWVFSSEVEQDKRIQYMKDALKISPLGVSVTAWFEDEDALYYSPKGMENNHWTMIYGYTEKGWKCLDSYFPFFKIVRFDHEITSAKRYHLERMNNNAGDKKSLLVKLIQSIKCLLNYLRFK